MVVPRAIVRQAELAAEVERAKGHLGLHVVHVNYSLEDDSIGDPAIYFRIVLADSASREETLADVTGQIEASLFNDLGPYENWGLTPYFSFRSQSEQAVLNDPSWS